MTSSLRSSGFRESRDRRRVLIVDPYVESDAGLRLLLESIGHTVCVACSAREALTVVSSFAPHVVLVDANLPDADGYELAQVFRELPGLEQSRIIAGAGTRPASFAARLAQPQNSEELMALIDESGDRESATG